MDCRRRVCSVDGRIRRYVMTMQASGFAASVPRELLQALVEGAPDALVVIDSAGLIRLVNAQTERMFGYDRKELVGQVVETLVPDRLRQRHAIHRGSFFRHPKARNMGTGLDLAGLRKDGTEFPVEISLSPLEMKTGVLVSSSIRDVTERRRGEEARVRLARMLREAERATGRGSWEWDIKTDTAVWSDGMYHAFGLDPSTFVNSNENFLNLVHPDDRTRMVEAMGAVLRSPGPFHQEYRLVRPDGAVRYFSGDGGVGVGADGQATVMYGIVEDVTEQRKAQEEALAAQQRIRDSEELFSTVFRRAALPMLILRARDRMVLDCNEAFGTTFGMDPATVRGQPLRSFDAQVAPELQPLILELIDRTGRVQAAEVRMTLPDGRPLYVLLSAAFVTLRGDRCSVTSMVDVTERKRAEAKAREAEAQFSAFFQDSVLPLAISRKRDGAIVEVNEAFTRVTGFTREEVIGRTGDQVGLLYDPERRTRALEELSQTGRVLEWETKIRTREGKVRDMLASITTLKLAGEECLAGSFFDITQRKLDERAIETARNELEAANKELEAFAYSVSHDLRAPLRAIDGFSQILRDDFAPELSQGARHEIDRILESTKEMAALVDDLLAFSRLGKQGMNRVDTDPAPIVGKVLKQLEPEAKGRRVEVVVRDLPRCHADPSLLHQVFANLLSNAYKYTRTRDPARIEVGWAPGPGAYFVRDNGIGFDMKYAGKLFGVFQRLHRAEDYEGTGVGLALVQRIVARHGGKIWPEAAPDKGATFFFTIPGSENHE